METERETIPLFNRGMDVGGRVPTLYGGQGDKAGKDDFMSDWPQWQYAGEIPMGPFVVAWVLGFFLGPLMAPLVMVCVVLSQMAKAAATGFDYFLMFVVLYLLAVMACTAVNTGFVLWLETSDDPEGKGGVTALDKWGPPTVYFMLYSWLMWVLARYFRSLSTDRYQSYPEKLQRLRGVPFYPKLIARRGPSAAPPTDVPSLIQKLSLYRDIFAVDKEADRQSNLHRSFTSDPLSAVSEIYSCWSEGGSSADTPVYELGAAVVMRSGWSVPLVVGGILAGFEVFIMRYAFGAGPPSSDKQFRIYCVTTAFWWFASALVWTVTLALFMLYHRQMRSLKHFSHMTSVFVPQPYSRFIIDLRSARNLLLWHEARTHLVDQVMQPTSFLRAVFDPTCFMMAWIGGGSIIALILISCLDDTPFWNQLTGLLLCKLLTVALFIQGVTYFTRNIQQVLKNHVGMMAHWQFALLRDLNELDSEAGPPPPAAGEIAHAEGICRQHLGSAFTAEAFASPYTSEARLAWRGAVIRYEQRVRARRKNGIAAEELDALQKALVLLERHYFRNTDARCSWEACGDEVGHMGPCYVVPTCGLPSTTTARLPTAMSTITSLSVSPLEVQHHHRAELYRRIWLIESILTHVRHRYIRPTILGLHLSGLLDVGVACLLAFNTMLLMKATVGGNYYYYNETSPNVFLADLF
eukprot:TRINITY_DN9697_c0_g2_i1.p1 TRINITY_DN9697_c0_g2~~TRINITY_DN9697_c0_g2_i1.p1  ORF type:complete len:692 (+),score=161.67 TRINITY_DN9697_c0_g2_i1:129-2204(+)